MVLFYRGGSVKCLVGEYISCLAVVVPKKPCAFRRLFVAGNIGYFRQFDYIHPVAGVDLGGPDCLSGNEYQVVRV